MMLFFDCNCSIGFERVPKFTFAETAEKMIAEMDYYCIDKALVHHTYAKYHNTEKGNEVLSRETDKYEDRLYPLYVYPASCNLETSDPCTFYKLINRKKVKGVLFQPVYGRYEFHTELFRESFELLNMMHMPIFIEFEPKSLNEYLPNYLELNGFLSKYSKIPLILLNTGYRFDVELLGLARQYANLYIEISGYQSNCALENFCDRIGSDRLLYGSRYPGLSPGASKYKVETAFIEDCLREDISFNNLNRLMEGITYYDI